MDNKMVDSKVYPLKELFADKFDVDFYQREYVWQRKHIEDLISDLTNEFLKNWSLSDDLKSVESYDPYYMGEIVISLKHNEKSAIIDGQQRITTITLLLIYLIKTYGDIEKFPVAEIDKLIYSDHYGERMFNLEVDDRKDCMLALYNNGEYNLKEDDSVSVRNLVDRYNDIADCWSERINEENIVFFAYWLKEKMVFSKVWTNSDEFAYVIFETMNDRGLSLTQVEMLRSYLLANVEDSKRNKAMERFDNLVKRLTGIKLSSKSKAEFEFFKVYFRSHYAEDMSQSNTSTDFVRIGREFHRWVRDSEEMLNLNSSGDFVDFLDRIIYFSKVYEKLYSIIQMRDAQKYLYLIVNSDYDFTLQPAPIIASVKYGDSDDVVEKKIQIVSRYITRVLSWRVWNHYQISQSSMEQLIYNLCKRLRDKSLEEIELILAEDPIELPKLKNSPTLNQANKKKLRVLISLITEIVAANSGESDYLLNKESMEIEHIWANHFELHTDEFSNESDFESVRDNIGDLLVLPKSFNSSYNDDEYSVKVQQYFSQNILAQSLHKNKYENNPRFVKFKNNSQLDFKPYDEFKKKSIEERAQLYKDILKWNWSEYSIFDDEMHENREKTLDDGTVLYYLLNTRGVDACGYILPDERFVVRAGSKISNFVSDVFKVNYKGASELRDELINSGVIKDWCFQEDYVFSKSSTAASVILGRNESGKKYWKDLDGRKLGDLNEI